MEEGASRRRTTLLALGLASIQQTNKNPTVEKKKKIASEQNWTISGRMHMPFEGIFHNLVLISIRKRYAGHARKVMHAIWGLGQAMFSKVVVIVDDDVDVVLPLRQKR